MPDWTKLGEEFLKLISRPLYSGVTWLVCLLLLLDWTPEFLHLSNFRAEYGQYIGLLCLFTFLVWLGEMGLTVWEKYRDWHTTKREERRVLAHLDSLAHDEAIVLARAIRDKSQTITWRRDAEEIYSLNEKGLLKLVSTADYVRLMSQPCIVPRFVWKEIQKNDVKNNIINLAKEVR
jgi:hypothetical protein